MEAERQRQAGISGRSLASATGCGGGVGTGKWEQRGSTVSTLGRFLLRLLLWLLSPVVSCCGAQWPRGLLACRCAGWLAGWLAGRSNLRRWVSAACPMISRNVGKLRHFTILRESEGQTEIQPD